MFFEPRDYLRHNLVEAEYLLNQSQPLTYERFAADETLRRAFVRSLEIIGEAVRSCQRSSGQHISRLSGVRLLRCVTA